MKTKINILAMLMVVMAMFLPTTVSAETVNIGTLTTLTSENDLDLSGNIVYAIDYGGPGRTMGPVPPVRL